MKQEEEDGPFPAGLLEELSRREKQVADADRALSRMERLVESSARPNREALLRRAFPALWAHAEAVVQEKKEKKEKKEKEGGAPSGNVAGVFMSKLYKKFTRPDFHLLQYSAKLGAGRVRTSKVFM